MKRPTRASPAQYEPMTGKDIVQQIKREIDSGYFNPLSLSDFADHYFVHPNYLSDLFFREVGSNFTKYLTAVRIEKARQYLKYTEFSIEKITSMVGYTDRGYFSRMFKAITGVGPGEYRKSFIDKLKSCNEEYVYVSVFRDEPLVIEQDMHGLQYFAKSHNVRAILEAPEDYYDVQLSIHILENVIRRQPAGLMVCATEKEFIPYINAAIDKGIPTITVDCDAPESRRIALVSSNWLEIGRELGLALAKAIHESGKIFALGMSKSHNTQVAYRALNDAMKDYPDILLLGVHDDEGSAKVAEQITQKLLALHPDVAGIVALDSRSAIGACAAIQKAQLKGRVKVTSVDMTRQHIELLKNEHIEMLYGQKRSLFTYYGGKLLYDCNHGAPEISKSIDKTQFYNIPSFIDTGCIRITRDNVEMLFGK